MKELKKWIEARIEAEAEIHGNKQEEDLNTSYDTVSYGAYMVAYHAVLEQIERMGNE